MGMDLALSLADPVDEELSFPPSFIHLPMG